VVNGAAKDSAAFLRAGHPLRNPKESLMTLVASPCGSRQRTGQGMAQYASAAKPPVRWSTDGGRRKSFAVLFAVALAGRRAPDFVPSTVNKPRNHRAERARHIRGACVIEVIFIPIYHRAVERYMTYRTVA